MNLLTPEPTEANCRPAVPPEVELPPEVLLWSLDYLAVKLQRSLKSLEGDIADGRLDPCPFRIGRGHSPAVRFAADELR